MNLAAVATSSTGIGLTWSASTDNVGVTGYLVERCSGANCSSFVQIATISGTTYSDAGLTASTSYSYRVRATDAAKNLSAYSNTASATTLAAAAIVVNVSPSAANLATGGTEAFSATVQNDSQTKGVSWSLSGSGCSGSACGTLSNTTATSATYTAPATQPSPATVTLTAVSQADSTKSASAQIVISASAAISVTVSPASATVQAGTGTQVFAATVNDTQNKGVTWSLSGAGCSGAACGTLTSVTTASATYNAPAAAPSPATVTLTATSVADSSKSASATISIAAAISVSVSPPSASVNVSLTQQFLATVHNDSQSLGVKWSVNGVAGGNATVGTVSSTGLYTAPASIPGSGVTVTATSVADPSVSSAASITVLAAVSVNVSPPTAGLQLSQSQNFSASVNNDPGSLGVTWSLSGAGCSGTACGTLTSVTTTTVTYTAPAVLPNPAAVSLTATSKRDGTKSSAATITLSAGAAITISLSPPSATLPAGSGTQSFTASLANDTQSKGVTWSLSGAGCSGAACGTLTNVTTTSATYNAPAAAPSPATVTLTATSVADSSKSTSVTISITAAISVNVSPKRGGLVISQTLKLRATLTNDTGNAGVTWSFTSSGAASGGGFLPASSTSDQPVTFTAPSSPGVVTITATSVADGSKSAVATVGVTDLTGVATYLNGNLRQGANAQEYALTTSGATAVNSSNFGKLFSCTVDAAIYAQPLWVAGIMIGSEPHNVVFVATEHDSVYAFDADSNASPCVPLWQASLIDAAHGATNPETWVSDSDTGCTDISPDVGIVGTPVIDLSSGDPNTGTLYVVSKSKDSTTFHQKIHALELTTGHEKFSPREITATVDGTGNGSMGGKLSFDPLINNQRSALLLTGGHVIVAWASHCDFGPYHGWVMSFSASTLAPEGVFNTSPNGINSGIWMSGSGPAADSNGNIYFAIGNGTFDVDIASAPNHNDYGDALLKLGPPNGTTFPVQSHFRSYTLTLPDNPADIDQGSGGLLLLPTVDSHSYLVQAGKDGHVYVADQASLGGFNPSSNNVVQWLYAAVTHGIWGSPTYWNGNVYFGAGDGNNPAMRSDPMRVFSFDSTATLSTSPTSVTTEKFAFPGPTPPVSASGTTNGIAWALEDLLYCTESSIGCGSAILHAYDATNLATEFWNSSQNAADAAGNAVKFTVPTIVNGKVYVGTRGNDSGSGGTSISGELDVYGLKPD